MHSDVLYVARLPRETLVHICWLLRNQNNGQPPVKQLALCALATTCRLLSDPALDVLWHTIASLVPLLLHTLPEDLCATVPLDNNGASWLSSQQVVFLRDPRPQDFRRFSIYARRVKVFSYRSGTSSFDKYDILPDVWLALVRFGPAPVFPNIQTLEHREADYRNLEERRYARGPFYPSEALLGPKMQVVHIDYGGWPSDQYRPSELVKVLAHWSPPALKELHIFAAVGGVPSTISKFRKTAFLCCPEIGLLQNLVAFEADSVNVMPAALAGLASLPRLQRLLLRVQASAYDWDTLPVPGQPGGFFPALADLHLYETACEWCVAFLHCVTSSALWKLHLDYLYEGPARMPAPLFAAVCAALARHPSRGTLQVLSITTAGFHHCFRGERAEVYAARDLAPLLALPALRSLTVSGNCQVVLDDALLAAMARAWPHIGAIEFAWAWADGEAQDGGRRGPGDANFPKATLAGLLPLARGCMSLRSLHIALDMRTVPDFDRTRVPPMCLWGHGTPSIDFLRLGGSVFPLGPDGARALVAFLSLVFPRMRALPMFGQDASSEEMGRLFTAAVQIRGQERRWALRNGLRLREPQLDGEPAARDTDVAED